METESRGRWQIGVFVTGCLLLSPVILPFALITGALTGRRRKRDAEEFDCVQCGSVLGQSAIDKADEYWRDHVRDLRQRFPGIRFRLVRKVWAICDTCGARYNYRTEERTFVLIDDAEAVGDGIVGR